MRSSGFLLSEVRSTNFGRGEDGEEGSSVADGFNIVSAALFAVDEAEDSGDVHAGFAGGFDGGDGGAAGGADVVDNDYGCSFFQEAFDLAAGTVGLFCFADEEAVDESGYGLGSGSEVEFAGEFENLIVIGEGPGAGAGGVGDEGVGTHGQAAYGFDPIRIRNMFVDEVVEDEAGEAAAFGVEGGDAAVNVIVGLFAARESEVAEFEGEGGDEVEQSGAIVNFRFRHDWLDGDGEVWGVHTKIWSHGQVK